MRCDGVIALLNWRSGANSPTLREMFDHMDRRTARIGQGEADSATCSGVDPSFSAAERSALSSMSRRPQTNTLSTPRFKPRSTVEVRERPDGCADESRQAHLQPIPTPCATCIGSGNRAVFTSYIWA